MIWRGKLLVQKNRKKENPKREMTGKVTGTTQREIIVLFLAFPRHEADFSPESPPSSEGECNRDISTGIKNTQRARWDALARCETSGLFDLKA